MDRGVWCYLVGCDVHLWHALEEGQCVLPPPLACECIEEGVACHYVHGHPGPLHLTTELHHLAHILIGTEREGGVRLGEMDGGYVAFYAKEDGYGRV